MEILNNQANKQEISNSYRHRHPFLTAAGLVGCTFLLTGAKGGCHDSGNEFNPLPERMEEVRQDQTPLERYTTDFIEPYQDIGYHRVYFDGEGGDGQSCLYETPYDTDQSSWPEDDAIGGRPQAGVIVSAENPDLITVVPGNPGLPKLIFKGLLDTSQALQPADVQTETQLEAYGCQVD